MSWWTYEMDDGEELDPIELCLLGGAAVLVASFAGAVIYAIVAGSIEAYTFASQNPTETLEWVGIIAGLPVGLTLLGLVIAVIVNGLSRWVG